MNLGMQIVVLQRIHQEADRPGISALRKGMLYLLTHERVGMIGEWGQQLHQSFVF